MVLYWKIIKKNYPYIFGNIVEWYDFSLYGYFAVIISKNYFPFYDKNQALFLTFVTFAVGFFARPFGGILFGWLGDKISHKHALKLSIQCIIWPTVFMGLLPSYQSWGIISTCCLVGLRLLQGISAGGQYGGCLTLLMEENTGMRAQACSLAHISALIGYLCAIIVSEVFLYVLPSAWESSITWRIPFIVSVVFWWIQKKALLQQSVTQTSNYSPILRLFKDYKASFVQAVLLSAVGGLFYYAIFVYTTSFLQESGYSLNQSLILNAFGLLLSCVALPFFAKLCDHVGRKPILYASCFIFLILSPIFIMLLSNAYWGWTAIGLALLVLVNTLFIAAVAVVYSELFPATVRYTGCALSFNVGVVLVGAMTPALLSYYVPKTLMFYGLYLSAGGLLGLITTYFIPETRNN